MAEDIWGGFKQGQFMSYDKVYKRQGIDSCPNGILDL